MDDGSDEDKWDGAQTNELNHEVQTDHFKSGDLKGIDLRKALVAQWREPVYFIL